MLHAFRFPARLRAAACVLLLCSSGAAIAAQQPAAKPGLEIVAALKERPGNIGVSTDGRIFLTLHPFDAPHYKLVEVLGDGSLRPYPSKEMSAAPQGAAGQNLAAGLINPLGIRITLRGILMLIDMGETGKGRPAMLKAFSLSNNSMVINYPIPGELLTPQSFLQDFAFDWVDNTALIADMGQADLTQPARPGLIIVYGNPLQKPRRVLDGHPSLMPPDTPMKAEGRAMEVKKDKQKVSVRAGLNPITIDPQRNWLYFGPMGAGKIYRAPLSVLKDINATPEEVAASVEEVADKPESDGMTIDADGNIYLTNVNDNEIGIIRGDGTRWGKYETYLKDERLIWPDGMCFGPDGMIYVTINQLNRSKPLNLGVEEGQPPYYVARFRPVAMGTIGR